jgi:hypothetical protein
MPAPAVATDLIVLQISELVLKMLASQQGELLDGTGRTVPRRKLAVVRHFLQSLLQG